MTAYRDLYQDLPSRVNRIWAHLKDQKFAKTETQKTTDQGQAADDDLSVASMLMAAAAGLAMPFESLKELGAGGKKGWNEHPAFQDVNQTQYIKSLRRCNSFLTKPVSDCQGLQSCELMICTDLKDIKQTAQHFDQAHACLNKEKTSTRQALKILRNALAHNNIVDLPGQDRQIEKLVFFSKNNWCSSCDRMEGWHVLVISVTAFRDFLDAWFEMLKDEDSYLGAATAVASE